MESRKRTHSEAFANSTDVSDQKECEEDLEFDPISGQGDEETPNTFSLFEEKYLSLDGIPAHLKRVGGLKEFISELHHVVLADYIPSLMFLYLHITSSPSEDSAKRTKLLSFLTLTLRDKFLVSSSPHFMVPVFELHLLKRVFRSEQDHITISPTDRVILQSLPASSTFFGADILALQECMLPICLLCEEIIKTSTHGILVSAAINALGYQRAFRFSTAAKKFGGNAEVDKLFLRITEEIFRVFRHLHKSVLRNAKAYLSARLQILIQDPLPALMNRINNIRLSTLSEEDAIILEVGGKVLQACSSDMDWRINQALDIIERLKDSPLVLSYFIFIRKSIQRRTTFKERESLRRLLPVLLAKAMLPDTTVPSLMAITTRRILQYGRKILEFKVAELPVDLFDRIQTTFLSEKYAKRVLENHRSLAAIGDSILRILLTKEHPITVFHKVGGSRICH